MSRFSSLCAISIIFSLLGSIEGAPSGEKGSCSSGSCSRCSRKDHSGSSYWYGLDRFFKFGFSGSGAKNTESTRNTGSTRNIGSKVGQGLSAYGRRFALSMRFKNKWRGVTISTCGDEKGILRARLHGVDPFYDFYLDKDCNNGHTTGVKPKYSFEKDHIKSETRDGKEVKMNLKGEEVTMTFDTDDDALVFHGWEWD